jgi:PIG-X / PBN1
VNVCRDRICPLLKELFGANIKCISQEESFSEPPVLAETLSDSSLQFHHVLPSIDQFVKYLQHKVCGLNDSKCVDSLLSADSIAIDYDSTKQATSLSVFWSQPLLGTSGWTEDIKKLGSAEKVEVGLLSNEKALDPEDVSLGGFLTVVGQDSKLSMQRNYRHDKQPFKHKSGLCANSEYTEPTLFSFPSRHHTLPGDATYSTAFETPTGLHPTLKISMAPLALTRPPAPEDTTCALHTYLTLPSTIFADKYQLSTKDHLFLNSHNLVGLRAVSGETDLEVPDWVLPSWGSNLLLELATPSEDQAIDGSGSWDVTIPLHLRYLKPSESGVQSASIPWPIVFWACSAEDGTEMGKNPFDLVDIGYDTLFPPGTFFFHLHPESNDSSKPRSGGTLVEEINVPVLKAAPDSERPYGEAASRVELGTVVAISIGFIWVLWKLISIVVSRRIDDSPPSSQESTRKANKKEK